MVKLKSPTAVTSLPPSFPPMLLAPAKLAELLLVELAIENQFVSDFLKFNNCLPCPPNLFPRGFRLLATH